MTIPKIRSFRPWHIKKSPLFEHLLKATPNLMMEISSVLPQVRSGHPNKIATSNDQQFPPAGVCLGGSSHSKWVEILRPGSWQPWICDKNTKFMQMCLVTHDDNIQKNKKKWLFAPFYYFNLQGTFILCEVPTLSLLRSPSHATLVLQKPKPSTNPEPRIHGIVPW